MCGIKLYTDVSFYSYVHVHVNGLPRDGGFYELSIIHRDPDRDQNQDSKPYEERKSMVSV